MFGQHELCLTQLAVDGSFLGNSYQIEDSIKANLVLFAVTKQILGEQCIKRKVRESREHFEAH